MYQSVVIDVVGERGGGGGEGGLHAYMINADTEAACTYSEWLVVDGHATVA